VFRRVILPVLRPGLASVAILNGVWMWNEFFVPPVRGRDDRRRGQRLANNMKRR
jgi:ABC-type glycerol-3-phosphate transport system permease component